MSRYVLENGVWRDTRIYKRSSKKDVKAKSDPKVDCLQSYAQSVISNWVKLNDEGKKEEAKHYMKMSMQTGAVVEEVLKKGPLCDKAINAATLAEAAITAMTEADKKVS